LLISQSRGMTYLVVGAAGAAESEVVMTPDDVIDGAASQN